MPDLSIDNMTQLAIAPAATDIMYIGDVSEPVLDDRNKHIEIENLFQYLEGTYQGDIVLATTATLDLSLGTIYINEAVNLTATSTELNLLSGVTGTLVTETGTQTLSNKTLVTPTIASFVNATHDHADAAGGGNTLTIPTIADFTNANHDHTSVAQGGVIPQVFAEDVNRNVVGGTNAGSELSAGVDNFFGGVRAGQFGDGSFNIGIGTDALQGTTANSYSRCIGIGYQTGLDLTTGSDNIIMGFAAGGNFDTGVQNVLIGTGAGGNFIGASSRNTAVGHNALQASVNVSTDNVGIGYRPGLSITTGSYNVLIGSDAGLLITTGSRNIAIGNTALSTATIRNDNIAIGEGALIACNSEENLAIGSNAGASMGSGSDSVYVGHNCGQNADGNRNTCVGWEAGKGNATSFHGFTVAIGYQAGFDLTNGGNNTYVGYQAGFTNQGGAGNVAIGYDSQNGTTGDNDGNVSVGQASLTALSTGDYNTCLGFNAGANITSGSYNIILGYIGQAASATGNDQFEIKGQATTFLRGTMNNHQLAIYGTGGYLNFNTTLGSTGYGFRDNSGVMESKDATGAWIAVNQRNMDLVIFASGSAVTVGDGTEALSIPANLNGLNLIDAIATVHTQGVTGTTDVQIRRRRAGADVDMLTTPITIAAEYFANDGVINTTNDDVQTGDQIYIDVDAIHSGTAPNGLSVTLTFGI